MKKLLENRVKIAKVTALISTICAIVGIICLYNAKSNAALDTLSTVLLAAQFITLVISYVLGGIVEALKTIWKIGKCGFYFLIPPINIVAFLVTFILGIIVALYLPIIPVSKMK